MSAVDSQFIEEKMGRVTPLIVFEPWPKIPRLRNGGIIITEKIDGTNAAIGVMENGTVYAQSRTRIITPGKSTDNFGFAAWVAEREDEIREKLGVGLHFGEWFGSGIQRGYGYTDGERQFALFNAHRWLVAPLPEGIRCVPQLDACAFTNEMIDNSLDFLRENGSMVSAPGALHQPAEGIVIYHTASRQLFKVMLENDDKPKGTFQGHKLPVAYWVDADGNQRVES